MKPIVPGMKRNVSRMDRIVSCVNEWVSLMDKFLSLMKRFYPRAMHLISSVKCFSLSLVKNRSLMNKKASCMKKSALRMIRKGLLESKNASFMNKKYPCMKEIYPWMIGFNSHMFHFASCVMRYNSWMKQCNGEVGGKNSRQKGLLVPRQNPCKKKSIPRPLFSFAQILEKSQIWLLHRFQG